MGGALIGLAAALIWHGYGVVAGVSGIVRSLLPPAKLQRWRLGFVVGLLTSGVVAARQWPERVPSPKASLLFMLLAGLFIGLGSGLANGCTSGHGVCGVARFSKRSLLATALFMASGAATVL